MATFEELVHSLTVSIVDMAVCFRKAQYDDALGVIDDMKGDLEKIEKIIEQRFAGETS